MKRNVIVLLVMLATTLFAQETVYFQQEMKYSIDAKLDTIVKKVIGSQKILYKNNAPDSLHTLYFYLYFNRYKEGALLLNGTLKNHTEGYIEIDSVFEAGMEVKDYNEDKTILELPLQKPLAPGESREIGFKFKAYLPYYAGRYGYNNNHYAVANWFPTPVAYDKEGWHLNQHIENEFYQEWGTFEVNITVPKGYVVGASGNLLNAEIAMQDTTQEVREWFSENPNDTTQFTTWKYKTGKVHDFAWTADPDFRYITAEWDQIKVHYLVVAENYNAWEKELKAAVESMRILSEKFGRYPYKQITIADNYITAGGMEYPNIVFINTNSIYSKSYFRAVVIHEIAHNWFYGLLANNQTEYEWLDEGFTTFAEIICMEEIYGKENNYGSDKYDWYSRTFPYKNDDRSDNYRTAMHLIKSGRELDPINTIPDKIRYRSYASQYSKTAVVLFMLKNVMGEQAFWNGMRDYFATWQYKHPQPKDFVTVMEKHYGSDLDWFYNQWFNSVRTLDYAVEGFESKKIEDHFVTELKLENRGTISMPFDLLAITSKGDSLWYRVPVSNLSGVHTKYEILDAWHFTQRHYNSVIVTDYPIEKIEIDPQNILLDKNRFNNDSDLLPNTEWRFLSRQNLAPPLNAYFINSRPTVHANAIDGIKLGVAFNGSWLNRYNLTKLSTWYKAKTNRLDFDFLYYNPFQNSSLFSWLVSGFAIDGRQKLALGLKYTPGRSHILRFQLRHFRVNNHEYNVPYNSWSKGSINALDFSYKFNFNNRGWHKGSVNFAISNGLDKSSFRRMEFSIKNQFYHYNTQSRLDIGLRLAGFTSNTPFQEQYNLLGKTAYAQFSNPLYRSFGSMPVKWQREGNMYYPDVAQVRGLGLKEFRSKYNFSNMNRVVALSTDLNVPTLLDLINFYPPFYLQNALFFDAGLGWDTEFSNKAPVYKSAGVSLIITDLGVLEQLFSLNKIQMDFPILVGKSGAEFKEPKLRWLLYIGFNL